MNRHKVVLVVEDDPEIRSGLIDIFNECGFETLQAENGLNAFDLLILRKGKSLPVDAVVSDHHMKCATGCIASKPETGLELLEAIRGLKIISDTPFLLITGDSDPKLIPKVVALDGHFMRKPLKLTKLVNLIGKMTAG